MFPAWYLGARPPYPWWDSFCWQHFFWMGRIHDEQFERTAIDFCFFHRGKENHAPLATWRATREYPWRNQKPKPFQFLTSRRICLSLAKTRQLYNIYKCLSSFSKKALRRQNTSKNYLQKPLKQFQKYLLKKKKKHSNSQPKPHQNPSPLWVSFCQACHLNSSRRASRFLTKASRRGTGRRLRKTPKWLHAWSPWLLSFVQADLFSVLKRLNINEIWHRWVISWIIPGLVRYSNCPATKKRLLRNSRSERKDPSASGHIWTFVWGHWGSCQGVQIRSPQKRRPWRKQTNIKAQEEPTVSATEHTWSPFF